MLHDDVWIARLGAASGLSYDSSARLWQCMVRQIELRLTGGGAIDMGELGFWGTAIREEYIAQLNEEKNYLIPPRLIPVIEEEQPRNGEVIALRDLADALMVATKIPCESVSHWLDQIFVTLQHHLISRENVTWAGLCVLSSGNGGYEIEFLETFGEAINRPFDMFAPSLVNDVALFRDLETLKCQTLATRFISPKTLLRKNSDPIVKRLNEDSTADRELLASLRLEKTQAASHPDNEATSCNNLNKLNRWLYTLLALLAVVGCILVFNKRQAISLSSPTGSSIEKASPSEQSTIHEPQDTLDLDKRKGAEIDAEHSASDHNKEEYFLLKRGDTLMRIALYKYGHKVFWVYIYEENRDVLKDPNNIPWGVRLRLPSACKYEIDPEDNNSVERALVLQRSLLK